MTGELETCVWSVWCRYFRWGVSGTHTSSQDPTHVPPGASTLSPGPPTRTHTDQTLTSQNASLATLRQPDGQAEERQARQGWGPPRPYSTASS